MHLPINTGVKDNLSRLLAAPADRGQDRHDQPCASSLTFPANFQLIATMNPCPCGYYGDAAKPCTCSSTTVTKYQKRISSPLLDRIDIHIEAPRFECDKLSDDRLGESSAAIQARVEAARQRQRDRFGAGAVGAKQPPSEDTPNLNNASTVQYNADMRPADVRQYCALDDTCRSLMRMAMSQPSAVL
jgi:magnesium chelatase family protein